MFKGIVNSLIFILIFVSPYGSAGYAQTNRDESGTILRIDNENQPTRVYYSVFVQSFYDSNNDGIGDLNGLTSKLEYLKDLGIGGLWLLPVHPSPTYHKYDVIDYRDIHQDYGTIEDYRNLVNKAHELDMLILLDLVVNHTSNQHPWFKKAISGNSEYRDYYVWSSKKEDFEKNPYQWHQVRNQNKKNKDGEKYYGLFWWEMPDLNYDEPRVREEIIDIGKFWLKEVGVDGFRLDAAEHIYPPDQLDKTLDWWKEFQSNMEKVNPEVIIIGEVWGGSQKTSPYLNSGFTAGFNFELSDSIRKSVLSGTNRGIIETVIGIQSNYRSSNPDFEDATILTNHDMERIMTEVSRDHNKAATAASLLLTLPGNPFIYYGEEIGMLGEKPDEYIREPFLWNVEGKDEGQTHWEIPYASSSKTVKPLIYQEDDRSSIYNHYKNLINLRNQNPALQRGSISKIETHNPGVIAFYRNTSEQEAIIIINLSDEMQRIPTLLGMNGFEMAYSNVNVFKINDKEISLQPYSVFILLRNSVEF